MDIKQIRADLTDTVDELGNRLRTLLEQRTTVNADIKTTRAELAEAERLLRALDGRKRTGASS